MLMSVAGGPYPFRCHTAIDYGHAPDIPRAQLRLDLLVPEDEPAGGGAALRPAVLYLHGGGWAYGQRGDAMYPWINPLLAGHGFVAASASYRLTDVAPFPAQLSDVKAAVRWLRAHADRYRIDPHRIGVWGDSAGGHLAALLGVTGGRSEFEGDCGTPGVDSSVQAVISRAGPTDFTDPAVSADPEWPWLTGRLFVGSPAERDRWRRLASPLRHVGPGAPPFLLVHGTADSVIAFGQSQRLAAALTAHGGTAELHAVPGAHHNLHTVRDAPPSDAVMAQLGRVTLDFFTRHLGTGPVAR